MYKVVLVPTDRENVEHVIFENGKIFFTPIRDAKMYKIYSKHFADDEWKFVTNVELKVNPIDFVNYYESVNTQMNTFVDTMIASEIQSIQHPINNGTDILSATDNISNTYTTEQNTYTFDDSEWNFAEWDT